MAITWIVTDLVTWAIDVAAVHGIAIYNSEKQAHSNSSLGSLSDT
jgi:hypothetical protein